ncbi:MAG: hypothetical protein U0X93_14065 [Anaerolineales bacterium]
MKPALEQIRAECKWMLLAVDTSNEWMGLAAYDGKQVVGERAWRSTQHHTVELAPPIQELLASKKLKMENITAVGVAIGPAVHDVCGLGWRWRRESRSRGIFR